MLITASIAAALLTAIAAPLLHRLAPRAARGLLPLVPLGIAAALAGSLPAVVAGSPRVSSHDWAPLVGLALSWRLDGLSLLFALLIAGIGAPVTLYAGTYLEGAPGLGRLYGFLFLFMASMLGVVLTDNGLALFVFWELTSLSSYFLIGFHHEREEARSAALCALLVTGSGGLALLAGVILLAQATGTYALSELAGGGAALRGHALYVPILLLVVAAAFTKSAQFPFHFWLPRAMVAPTPVSAYLHAATMVTAGVYLLARMSPALAGTPLWELLLIGGGGSTALVGSVLAMGAHHFKRILAYSTVGALGLLVLLLGIGTTGAALAMATLLLAHALYKGALFLVAGAVDHTLHETEVERLGRLRHGLPLTALAALLGALSMAGAPLLLGYLGKEAVLEATTGSARAAAATACVVVVSALFLAVAVRVGIRPFWSRRTRAAVPGGEAPWPLWSAPLVLGVAGLLLGSWPNLAAGLLGAAAGVVVPGHAPPPLALWHGVGAPLLWSLVTAALGLAVYGQRVRLWRLARPLAALAKFGPDRGYTAAVAGLNRVAAAQTRFLQRGYLRGYLFIILTTTLALLGYTLVVRHGLPSALSLRDLRAHEVIIVVLIVAAAWSSISAESRFASVLALGVVGYGIALIFVLFGAPDLGITQLVVETLTVILVVVAFRHLPHFKELSSRRARVRDGLLAIGFGALTTALVLVASHTVVAAPISRYYGAASLPEGHGRNVVNVILTDFRGLDTLGEITVLATAAFGVIALLKLRARGRDAA